MLNVLVIENNPYQLVNIVNILCSNIDKIRLYSISFDGESVLELLKTTKIDIIILNSKLPDISGIDIINYIDNKKLYKYKNSIIIFSNEINALNSTHSKYLYSYILKSEGYEKLIDTVKLLIKEKGHEKIKNQLTYKIDRELKHLNYNFSYQGTKYLREAIIEIFKIKDKFDGKIEKNIYSIIAKKHNKKINTIYCDIKQATNIMIMDCKEEVLIKYFNYTYFTKPKVKEIIITIINKIA